jgi:hypothetical protein
MRLIFIILIILSVSLVVKAQFLFQTDFEKQPLFADKLINTDLAPPNYDSIQFELRFWNVGTFGGFIQMTVDYNGNWNYRRGYLTEEYQIKNLKLNLSQSSLETIWEKLSNLNIMELPDQDKLTFKIERNGKSIILGPQENETEKIIHNTLDADGYIVELFAKGRYRNYYYYNPIGINKIFKLNNIISKETEQFASIVTILSDNFNMIEVYKANLKEKMKN